MYADFCVEAQEEALARHGKPEIFNSDQGSQFTGVLKDTGVKISMDGRGRWMDNVFIERLWRSMKYECVYLHAFETGLEWRRGLAKWISFYNTRRPHSQFDGRTPDEVYFQIATTPSPWQHGRDPGLAYSGYRLCAGSFFLVLPPRASHG